MTRNLAFSHDEVPHLVSSAGSETEGSHAFPDEVTAATNRTTDQVPDMSIVNNSSLSHNVHNDQIFVASNAETTQPVSSTSRSPLDEVIVISPHPEQTNVLLSSPQHQTPADLSSVYSTTIQNDAATDNAASTIFHMPSSIAIPVINTPAISATNTSTTSSALTGDRPEINVCPRIIITPPTPTEVTIATPLSTMTTSHSTTTTATTTATPPATTTTPATTDTVDTPQQKRRTFGFFRSRKSSGAPSSASSPSTATTSTTISPASRLRSVSEADAPAVRMHVGEELKDDNRLDPLARSAEIDEWIRAYKEADAAIVDDSTKFAVRRSRTKELLIPFLMKRAQRGQFLDVLELLTEPEIESALLAYQQSSFEKAAANKKGNDVLWDGYKHTVAKVRKDIARLLGIWNNVKLCYRINQSGMEVNDKRELALVLYNAQPRVMDALTAPKLSVIKVGRAFKKLSDIKGISYADWLRVAKIIRRYKW